MPERPGKPGGVGKLGDLPTIKLLPEQLAAFARKADESVLAGQPASATDLALRVQPADPIAPVGGRRSGLLPASRGLAGVSLESVPVIAVSREDLAWFELDDSARALLAAIDGRTTLAAIFASLALDPAEAIAVLHELVLQRVIAFA